ncbi:Zinc-binding protein A33 [Labeo rohita]|uniref:Zinc-binding protein A33 n=1 Tax=Labeo rohita TaxID=84645 RepID=A0ABQ8MY51_LABRO|nr:Zinc-binding protein A33 [Labeo rohita]
MGRKENLLICSFFASVYLLTQTECGLQKDLDEMKVKCRDSYKVAKDNIDGLKNQLDGLFKQVSAIQSPAKDVLNILQKVVDLQELEAIINTERNATKIERLDKRRKEAEKDLAEMKKDFSGSVEIFDGAVSKINKEMLKSDKATSTPLNDLKKYMEDKLKQGEQGDVAKQVLQIVKLQIEAIELMTRISGKFKMQAQMDAITSKLEFKNGLLSDLKEERQESRGKTQKIDMLIAANEKEILELNAELSALKQTFVQIDEQANAFDGKRTEIMDKIAKLKGKDELISRILKLQFEFMEAVITAQGQMKADEFKINDLQKELEKEQERALYLDGDNRSLRKKLFIQAEQCKDVMDQYKNAEAELNTQINKVTDKTSKGALQIILQGFEIDQLTKQITASPSNDNLKRTRDDKLKELKLKKEELQKTDASAEKILKVISQMEEIWKLQTEDPGNIDKISKLQENLLKLINDLDDKMASKPMLKIIALQSGVTWIREMLKTVTKQAEIEKAEIQKELDAKNRKLNEKNKELTAATDNISQLKQDIAALKKDISALEIQKETAQNSAEQTIKDLQKNLKQSVEALDDANKSLKEKNGILSQQTTKINNLLDEVRTLKQQVQEKESQLNFRIADLEKSLALKEEENAEIRAENEAFYIKNLIDEIQYLDKQIAQGFPELQGELEEKKMELAEAKQKLQAQGSIAAKTLDVLELLSDIGKLQENPTEQNSERIRKQEAKLNGLLGELQNSGDAGLGLGLKEQINKKEKEISLLQATCDLSENLNKKIKELEKELKESKQKMKELRQESDDKIAFKELNKLNDDIKKITEEKLIALQGANKQIADLQEKVQKQEEKLAKKDQDLKEKDESISALKQQKDDMKGELEKVKNKNKDLENTLETKKQELHKTDQKLKEKEKEVATLQKENADKKSELKEKEDKLQDVITEKKKLQENLDEAKQKLKELEKWPTFDAKTAHRRLILSQNEREARTSLLPQSVPDNPERYDTAIAALGKIGYDSEKHYWEIGVTGRNCYVVGAAKASAQRKGILKYGPAAGYWVIQKSRGSKLFAIADSQLQLNTDAPSIIGVQLDFKNNQVTFYNAERRFKIYSFDGNQLQGKIYPYVESCSGNDEPPFILRQPQSTDWLKQ